MRSFRSALNASRPDEGAAAVEFALLLPIFVMLVFGSLSSGIAYWKHISDVQAGRDAARYGSTLPFVDGGTATTCGDAGISVTTWLTCVRDVAISESASWNTVADIGTDSGYVCVAYIKSDTAGATGTVLTTNLVAGTNGGDPPLPTAGGTGSTGGCFLDNRHDNRVQVVIGRDGQFNAVLLGRTWRMTSRVSVPYERGAP
jgi:Flp pilus assembly protein TadG